MKHVHIICLSAVWCCVNALPGLAAAERAIGVAEAPKRGTGGRRWAFIVGVNKYLYVPKLRYPVADARLLHKTLCERAAFERERTLLLTDDQVELKDKPTRTNIIRQLAMFLKYPAREDTVLVFFSGHGFRDAQDRGFLAPQDAEKDSLALTCVPIAEVKRLFVLREYRREQEPLKDVRVQGVMVLARAGSGPPPVAPTPVHPARPTRPTTPPARPAAPPGELTNSVGMKLVYIKPGSFMMGSPPGEEKRDDDEKQHRVAITKGFYLGAHEVTQEQYEKIMGNNPSYFKKGGNYPVETVTWNDAVELCKRLSQKEGKTYRLPTEAEWEYACRAGTTTPFAFGQTISTDQANYDGDYTYGEGRKGEDRKCTTPVGSSQPNAWGLYDMHGNLWEWCQDWYAGYGGDTQDSQGPQSGSARVLRGGSWLNYPKYCRSAARGRSPPASPNYYSGFRVVCVVSSPLR